MRENHQILTTPNLFPKVINNKGKRSLAFNRPAEWSSQSLPTLDELITASHCHQQAHKMHRFIPPVKSTRVTASLDMRWDGAATLTIGGAGGVSFTAAFVSCSCFVERECVSRSFIYVCRVVGCCCLLQVMLLLRPKKGTHLKVLTHVWKIVAQNFSLLNSWSVSLPRVSSLLSTRSYCYCLFFVVRAALWTDLLS